MSKGAIVVRLHNDAHISRDRRQSRGRNRRRRGRSDRGVLHQPSLSAARRRSRASASGLATPESTPRRVSPALAHERIPGRSGHPGRRVRHVPGGEARDLLATGARVGDRHQRDESRAHERARAEAQPDESRRHAAANRAGARPRPHLRPDYLHRRPAPSRRSRRWSSSAAIGAEARGGHAPDGLCALRAYRRVHAAGVLPPARHRHFGA